jgi:hypothetical protein
MFKDLLFAAAYRPAIEKVDTSSWFSGGEVFVRVLSGTDADTYNAAVAQTREDKCYVRMEATMIALSLCDKDGNKLCGPDDIQAIMQWPSTRIEALWRVASKLNRVGDGDEAVVEGN